MLTPHQLYLQFGDSDPDGDSDPERRAAYRPLSRLQLDWAAIYDIRLALSQNPLLGNARFLDRTHDRVAQRSAATGLPED